MKTRTSAFLIGLVAIGGVVCAFAAGYVDEAADGVADTVFLGELDLAERMEIWRNQYSRMTPGDTPLVQDVGTWPAAWEEFGSAWNAAPAERDLATWLVPFSVERTGALTVLRDANGIALWSGATDFAKEESSNVTLTGALVSDEDWVLYQAAREEIGSRLSKGGGLRDGEGGGDPSEVRFVSAMANFSTNPPEFRVGLQWTNEISMDIFAFGPWHVQSNSVVTYTNDENVVVTYTNTTWHFTEAGLTGLDSHWVQVGTVMLTNDDEVVFVDNTFPMNRGIVRFYAAFESGDADGDGLNDAFEAQLGTSTNSYDTDNDGINDRLEQAAGGNPTVSNVWWIVMTTNEFFRQFPLPDCQQNTPSTNIFDFIVDGQQPIAGSVVSNVTVSGYVDDAIKVDGHGVDFAPNVQSFDARCITNEIADLQGKHFILALWDWPNPVHEGENEARIGNSANDPFRVEWTWIAPLDFRLEHINANGNPLVVNPSGTRPNREFTCEATLLPMDFPETNIFWSCTNAGMSFVGGVTNGRTVQLKGTQPGDWEATVTVKDSTNELFSAKLHGTVLEKKTVPVYLHIVCDDAGNNAAMTVAEFQTLLSGANQIWEQAAIEFQLDTNLIVYTNKTEWLDISADNDWAECDDLQSIDSHTGGLEIYCVRNLDNDVVGLTCMAQSVAAGLTIANTATAGTLAHELGHACGLDDIYTSRPSRNPTVFFPANATNAVEQNWEPHDWCTEVLQGGYGMLTQSNLIHRLLMYGVDETDAVDIPSGTVRGLDHDGHTNNIAVGISGLGNRQPMHW